MRLDEGLRTVEPGPEAVKLRREVREYLAGRLAAGDFVPRSDAWLAGWDPAFSRGLGERGWLGMTIPERYGGSGRSALDRYVVTEELLAAGAPVAAHWIADRQVAPALLRHGNEHLRERYLPRIASGECYFAIGLSEPDAGSDLANIRTAARRAPGGWLINGTKVWTSGAHLAEAFFVLARSAPREEGGRHAGLSQFCVELGAEGVTVRPILMLDGGHHFNEVVLEDVFVPDAMVVGEIGAGWAQATAELAFERSGPERFLSTFPLLRVLLEHLRERGGGAAPAAAQVGLIAARLWSLRQVSLGVAAALAEGEVPDVAAALVKDAGTRLEGDIVELARALARVEPDPGGAGIARALAEAVTHAPGFTLRGGTNEILRMVVARALGAS